MVTNDGGPLFMCAPFRSVSDLFKCLLTLSTAGEILDELGTLSHGIVMYADAVFLT